MTNSNDLLQDFYNASNNQVSEAIELWFDSSDCSITSIRRIVAAGLREIEAYRKSKFDEDSLKEVFLVSNDGEYANGEFDRTVPPDAYFGQYEDACVFTEEESAQNFAAEFGGDIEEFLLVPKEELKNWF